MWALKVEDWSELLIMSRLSGVIDSAAIKSALSVAGYDQDFYGTPFSDDFGQSNEFAAGFHEGVMEVFDQVMNARFIEDGGTPTPEPDFIDEEENENPKAA